MSPSRSLAGLASRALVAQIALVSLVVATGVGCAPTLESGCRAHTECPPDHQCAAGRCLAKASGDAAADGDAGRDNPPDIAPRPDALPPRDAQPVERDGDAPPADAATAPDAPVNAKPDADRPDAAERDAAPVSDADIEPPRPEATVEPPVPDAAEPPPPDATLVPCVPEEEQCDLLDNNCDGVVDNIELPCTAGEGVCVAAGVLVCGRGGEQRCEAALGAPQAEQCDRVDNDCDGLIDENQAGETLSVTCYEGPPGTRGVGVCAGGQRTCDPNAGVFGDCGFQTLPSAEVCDGLDNNCNGTVDDIATPPSCYEGDPAALLAPATACRAGLELCTAGQLACTDQRLPAELDDCNGVNDDCDELIDEDCFCEQGAPCSGAAVGQCRPGTQLCHLGQLVSCEGQILPEGDELCDGQDNDCDGETDEGTDETCFDGHPGLVGAGVCRSGTRVCAGGALSADCVEQVLPTHEACNGRDDDCNGGVDDVFAPAVGADCSVGLGVCRRDSVFVCTEDAAGTVCAAVAGPPSSEVCNGQDDDCDGEVDNGADAVCYDGEPQSRGIGNCVAGVRTCANGALGACVGQVTPQVELCNGRREDEDCDGLVDEICLCDEGESIECGRDAPPCQAGRQRCVAGAFGPCEGAVGPTDEVCDFVDNDCNGVLDDVPANVCYSGPEGTQGVGTCVAGHETCKNINLVCAAEMAPVPEVCDDLDNDCDGVVDNLIAGGAGRCDTGLLGACRLGQQDCVGGRMTCVQTVQPTAETCNGVDDDCDGTVDEPPILTRAEYEVDPGTLNAGRPGFVSSGDGFLGVYGVSNGRDGAVAGRTMNRTGAPQAARTLLTAGAGGQSAGTLRAVLNSPDRVNQNRRYVAGWLENGHIRFQSLGDDGTPHGSAPQTLESVDDGAISAFDMATSPTGIAFAWLEDDLVGGGQRIVVANSRDDGTALARPTTFGLPAARRSAVALGVNASVQPTLFGVAWSENVGGLGPVKVAIVDGVNAPITGTMANLGQLGDVVETSTGFAITWVETVGNTLFVRRFQRDGIASAAIQVSQSASSRTGLSLDALQDGGLGLLFHESDAIWYHRLNAAGTVHPQRARVGSYGTFGLDATLSRSGTAAFWVYGARGVDGGSVISARMALGEFLCAP